MTGIAHAVFQVEADPKKVLSHYPDALRAVRRAARTLLGEDPGDGPQVSARRRGETTRVRFSWRELSLDAEYAPGDRRITRLSERQRARGTAPPAPISDAEAVARALRFGKELGVLDANWRAARTTIARESLDEDETWRVVLIQTVRGYPAFAHRISCGVRAGNGRVSSWSHECGECIDGPSHRRVARDEALAIARRALVACGGREDAPLAPTFSEAGDLGWTPVWIYGPLSRLAYRFYFRLHAGQGDTPNVAEVVVDAETGELLRVANMGDFASPVDSQRATCSPRLALAADLLALSHTDIKPVPRTLTTRIARALLSGSPAQSTSGRSEGVRFQVEAGLRKRRTMEMVYQRAQKALAWQDAAAAWWRVDLTADGVARVEAYLKDPKPRQE